jgi:SagB-type dehydrogenase family enzyme
VASIETHRQFLKPKEWAEWDTLDRDEAKGVPPPPLQKPYPPDATLVDLVAPDDLTVGTMPLIETIRARKSHRRFTPEPLTLEELSFLLWATQGVHEIWLNAKATRRTVPSGGSRHPFETTLLVYRVTGLEPGLYRYLAMEHRLYRLHPASELHVPDYLSRRSPAVYFIWTAVPYRTEWRYSVLAGKLIAQDSGHVCQNLYLACTAIGAGACAIGAYDQEALDAILGLDGYDELAVYIATTGKVPG